MKSVYIGMTADILHPGLINIISEGAKYGEVTIGLLTDKAVSEHKRVPFMTWEQRKNVLEHITGVTRVVAQDEWSYSANLRRLRPDYMLHGDDWRSGPLAEIREEAIQILNEIGSTLIEVPYTPGISSGAAALDTLNYFKSPDVRRGYLRRLLRSKGFLRLMETHSPLAALIVETTRVNVNGQEREFDGFWSSSLADSTLMAMPDIEALDISARLSVIDRILQATTKPLVLDADTGGHAEHLALNLKTVERMGLSGVIIEDKVGLKRNSLLGNDVHQLQAPVRDFSEKIRLGRDSVADPDFMLIARIESLILQAGMPDAVARADAYVKAGADGIMIHSRRKDPDEIFEFMGIFRCEHPDVPVVVVPTTYSIVTEDQLREAGVNVVIYANHLIRSIYPAMKNTAEKILRSGRSWEIEQELEPVDSILRLVPGTR